MFYYSVFYEDEYNHDVYHDLNKICSVKFKAN